MRTNTGADLQSRVMGGDNVGDAGTSSAVTATSLTKSSSAVTWTTDMFKGHVVVTGSVYGVVTANSTTVLTVDKWYTPNNPGGAAATTPATGGFVVLAGGQPAFWIALSTDATAPAATDTVLASELTTGGLQRQVATYAHTTGATTYTLTKTFTSSDATPRTVNKIGVFNASAGGDLVFTTAVPNPPIVASGDQLTITETVNL